MNSHTWQYLTVQHKRWIKGKFKSSLKHNTNEKEEGKKEGREESEKEVKGETERLNLMHLQVIYSGQISSLQTHAWPLKWGTYWWKLSASTKYPMHIMWLHACMAVCFIFGMTNYKHLQWLFKNWSEKVTHLEWVLCHHKSNCHNSHSK